MNWILACGDRMQTPLNSCKQHKNETEIQLHMFDGRVFGLWCARIRQFQMVSIQ